MRVLVLGDDRRDGSESRGRLDGCCGRDTCDMLRNVLRNALVEIFPGIASSIVYSGGSVLVQMKQEGGRVGERREMWTERSAARLSGRDSQGDGSR